MPSLPCIHVAVYCNSESFVPAAVSLYSLISAHSTGREYCCHVLHHGLNGEQLDLLTQMEAPGIRVLPNPCSLQDEDAAFRELPRLLPEVDKILWVSAGSLFLKDCALLFDTELQNKYGAAVLSFPDKNAYGRNAMLLLLPALRMMPKALSARNLLPLPPHMALDGSALWGAWREWEVNQLNRFYGTQYANEKQIFADAVLLCYSGIEKPWKTDSAPFASQWKKLCLAAPLGKYQPFRAPQPHSEPYMVSVVMPCYNTGPYMAETLDSVFNQSYQDFELICCDDESTDDTLAILKRYAALHPNMTVLSGIKENAGFQRNRGTAAAKGKYVYYMDSDDIMDPDTLAICVEEAELMALDAVYFEGESFFENKELNQKFKKLVTMYGRTHLYPFLMDGRDFFAVGRIRGEFPTQPCLKLTRLALLKENGIRFSEVRQMNDTLQSLKTVIAARRCTVLPLCLYHRRVHENSIVTGKNYNDVERMIESRLVCWIGVCLLANEHHADPKTHKALLSFASYIKAELDAVLEHAELPLDLSFVSLHYNAEDIINAMGNWMALQSRSRSGIAKKMASATQSMKNSALFPVIYNVRKKLSSPKK